jgi:glutaredoxin
MALLARSALAVTLLLGGLTGCDAVLTWSTEILNERPADEAMADETGSLADEAELAGEEVELPERPADSIAHSAKGVSRFAAILENEEMTREQRIRAFQNLDPGALQAPAARPAVAGGPAAQDGASTARSREPKDWEIANSRKRVPIVMFSTSWCGVCKRARAYFEKEGIVFIEHDVDKNQAARAEYLALNPKRSVPTIKIGNEVIVGFSERAVESALDAAARSRLH